MPQTVVKYKGQAGRSIAAVHAHGVRIARVRFAAPRPNSMVTNFSSQTIATYNRIASHFSQTHYEVSFWQKELKIFASLVPGKKIIDIGCGAGRDAEFFTTHGLDYTGIDASAGLLAEASKRLPQAKFILMNFYKLNLPPNSFDGFWAAASLLHIPKNKINRVLSDIKNIIKPNGIGFISLKQKTRLDAGLIKEHKYGATIERYFAFYDPSEFQTILAHAGFAVVKHHILKENDVNHTHWLCYFVRKA